MPVMNIIQLIMLMAASIVPVVQTMHSNGATKKQMAVGAIKAMIGAVPIAEQVLPTNIDTHINNVVQVAYDLSKATGTLPPAVVPMPVVP